MDVIDTSVPCIADREMLDERVCAVRSVMAASVDAGQ